MQKYICAKPKEIVGNLLKKKKMSSNFGNLIFMQFREIFFNWNGLEIPNIIKPFCITLFKICINVLVFPFFFAYMNGPTLIGFWGGKSDARICVELNGSNEEFWKFNEMNIQECERTIMKHFFQLLTLFGTLVYYGILVKFVYLIFVKLCNPRKKKVNSKKRIYSPTKLKSSIRFKKASSSTSAEKYRIFHILGKRSSSSSSASDNEKNSPTVK